MNEILKHFAQNNLDPPDLILDGKIHRFSVDSNDSKKSGWYLGFQNHTRKTGEIFYVVVYGNYKTGDKFTFQSNVSLKPEDKKVIEDQIKKAKKHQDADRKKIHEETAIEVEKEFSSLQKEGECNYLKKKLLSDTLDLGIKFDSKNNIYVPLLDIDGKIWSYQRIQDDGSKYFHSSARIKECFHVLGNIESSDKVFVCEGFATGASIFLATNHPTVITFQASNLLSVSKALKNKYKEKSFIICGDDDIFNETNIGREKAEEAAKACLGKVIFPEFKNLIDKKTTDFSDLHILEGLDEVKRQLLSVQVEKHFILPLGFKEKEYFFTSSQNRQIVSITTFKESDLLGLMDLEYWENSFPGKGAQSVNWAQAKSTLMKEARSHGIFQSRHVRGAGVWNDDGRLVVNMGDHLIVDGRRVELGEFVSRFFYTLGVALPALRVDPLGADECDLLIKVCSKFKWVKPDFSFLMAGALVTLRICGALPVRPHIWLTGGSSTGKSTLFTRLVNPIIGNPVCRVIGATSEAGVRQALKSDAIPVVFDEFETTGIGSSEKIQSCIELMRAAWSDSDAFIIKGSASGNAEAYQARFSAIVSSIRVNLKNDADRSRFAVLELAPHGSDHEHWRELSSFLEEIDQDYGNRLFARSIKMLPILSKNFKRIKKSLATKVSQRFGDQYGMLLAGYSILLSDSELTDEQVEQLAGSVNLVDEKEEAKISDQDEAKTHILTKKAKFELGSITKEISISEAINDARFDEKMDSALQRIGIRVYRDSVCIAIRHNELESLIFKNTRWSNSWANSLARIDGVEKNKSVWIAGKNQKCVKIPLFSMIDREIIS